MITSPQNSKIKLVRGLLGRAKERHEERAFVVEGVRLVKEAVSSHWEVRFVLYDESLNERGMTQIEQLRSRGVEVELVSGNLMKDLSETETPQGILAVVELSEIPFPEDPNFILILDQIRDPGNLGTLLRTATAAGVQGVFLPPETTDAFAPKVIRAGMGAHFRLPVRSMSWDEIYEKIKGLRVHLANMDGPSFWETDLRRPLALIIGGEAEGASDEARKMATREISIPMSEGIESLNAGVAGSVLMFEVVRQRLKQKEQ